MRRTRLHARAIAMLTLLAVPFAAFAVTGQVVYTEGDVSRQSGGQTQDASIGDPVGAGDVITTGPRSVAVIDLTNGTTLKLKEKTTLAIDSIGESTAVTLS